MTRIATIVKYFALNLNEQAYKSLLNIPEANQAIKWAFIANLNKEMKKLVSSSVLRNSSPTDLTAFRLETFQQELAEKAPETFDFRKNCISTRASREST